MCESVCASVRIQREDSVQLKLSRKFVKNVVKLTNAEIGSETLKIFTPIMCRCSLLQMCFESLSVIDVASAL